VVGDLDAATTNHFSEHSSIVSQMFSRGWEMQPRIKVEISEKAFKKQAML
jgi:hypothetical protein